MSGYRIRMETEGEATVAQVDVMDVISWYGVDASALAREIRDLDVDEIVVNLNSPGGDVFDGITILNALRQHKASTRANVMGLAASAASFIACGCDEVVMADNSQMMIHDASGVVIGNATDMAEMADLLSKISDNIAGIYAAKAGGKPSEWRDVMREEHWYDADEAVAAGLADRVDRKTPAKPKGKASNETRAHTVAQARSALASMSFQTSVVASGSEPAAVPVNRREALMGLKEKIAQRLGMTDTAVDEEQILAALDEALEEQAEDVDGEHAIDDPQDVDEEKAKASAGDPAPNATGHPEPKMGATAPEGVVMLDQDAYAALQAEAEAGRQAKAEQLASRRASIVDEAIKDGKIPPARRDHWVAQLAADEEGATAVLNSLAAGTIPLAELGGQGAAVDDEAPYERIYGHKEA